MPDHAATDTPGDASAVLPLALIDEAVAVAGKAQRRRRLLPAAAVVIFALACALFRADGYAEVAAKVEGWLAGLAGPGGWAMPGTSALAKARRRLGPGPLRALFARLAGPLADPGMPGAFAFGLLLAALDGTMLDVPHTPANVAAFGTPPSNGGHANGGWPQVRLVTVVACGTRGIIDAAFRGRRCPAASEQDLARKIAARGRLGPGMLVIADRNFCGYPVAATLAATGAGLLIRAKPPTARWLPALQPLPDGSYLSVLPEPASGRAHASARYRGKPLPGPPAGLPVRVIEADIAITPAGAQPRTERYRLITTLLDHQAAPAADLAATYAQRWEIENGYREMKAFTHGTRRPLRSASPAGITQEIWALLCASQLIHATRAGAAQAAPGLDPDRISYTVTLRALRRAITGHRTRRAVRAEALARLLPPRRPRSYPRLTLAGTARRRTARAGLTGIITCQITIIKPGPPGPEP